MSPIIEVKDLVKRYKKAEKNAVDNISFSVEEGEFFAFLGPNGAGKTTTISILTTTLSKTSGTVTIAGYDLDKEQSDVRQSIGIIFQNPSLDRNLTGEENIRFHAILYGLYPFRPNFSMMPDEYKKRVHSLAKILDMEHDMFKAINTYSGGMKRKLEIVRGLMHKPKVLFLDEPTVGLDPLSRKNLWEYLKEVRKTEKTTVFLTTHYLDEAEEADRICIVNHGKIIELGTPDQIKEKLIEEYLLVDAKDRKALMTELTTKKIPFTKDREIKIDIHETGAQDIIKQIDTPLSHLEIHMPTLEDAYLEIIGEAKDKK
ncbi:ATP-binding cassette domain-containing protein [soil metagenome]